MRSSAPRTAAEKRPKTLSNQRLAPLEAGHVSLTGGLRRLRGRPLTQRLYLVAAVLFWQKYSLNEVGPAVVVVAGAGLPVASPHRLRHRGDSADALQQNDAKLTDLDIASRGSSAALLELVLKAKDRNASLPPFLRKVLKK